MRLTLDCRMIEHAGIGTYVGSLLDGLLDTAWGWEFVLLGSPQKLASFNRGAGVTVRSLEAPIYGVQEQWTLPSRIGKTDLFHAPHYNVPVFFGGRLVVTIHDLLHLAFPEFLPNRSAWAYARTMLKLATRKARKIIAISEHTRQDLVRRLGVPERKVQVIYEAAPPMYAEPISPEFLASTRRNFDLPERFILYVGALKQHKNLERLLEAHAALHAKGWKEPLVLVGHFDWKAVRLMAKLKQAIQEGRARYLGELPKSNLPALYRLATLFVFPSLYEGFGLPPLEAMASGTPVAVARATSLPEVVGEAGLTFDPYSVSEMADAMEKLLSSDGLRARLSQAGREQSARFSWARCAEQTLRLYQDAVS